MNDHDNMFCHRKFRGTFSSVNMLKEYMLISRNAERVHGKRKVGNPCTKVTRSRWFKTCGALKKRFEILTVYYLIMFYHGISPLLSAPFVSFGAANSPQIGRSSFQQRFLHLATLRSSIAHNGVCDVTITRSKHHASFNGSASGSLAAAQ